MLPIYAPFHMAILGTSERSRKHLVWMIQNALMNRIFLFFWEGSESAKRRQILDWRESKLFKAKVGGIPLHMKKTKKKKKKKKRNWCVRPGVSCPVPVFSRHDRHANSTLSALQLEVRKIPFPICFRFRRGSFLLFLFIFLYWSF